MCIRYRFLQGMLFIICIYIHRVKNWYFVTFWWQFLKSDWNHRYPFNINIVHFYNIYIYLHMIFISSRTKLHLSYLVTKIWLYYSTILTDQAQNLVRHVQFITLQTAEFKQIPTNKRIKCEAISMNKLMTIFDHNYSYLWSNIVVNLFRFIASRCIWWTRSLQIKNARIRW